jgi:CheY-like chemotaxis protein
VYEIGFFGTKPREEAERERELPCDPTGVGRLAAVMEAFAPDVVLCDIGLPDSNGFVVAAALRKDPETATARLIAVTAYGADEDRRRAKAVGFDLHLVKPVDPEVLLDKLEA